MQEAPRLTDALAPAQTIPQLVRLAGAHFGDRSAIEEGEARLSFAELADAGLRSARAFLAAGIQRGDRVAIWAPNMYEWILAAIGLQSAGAVLVPLNTRLKGMEAGYQLRKTRARILCTVTDFLGTDYAALLAEEELPDLEQVVVLRGPAKGGVTWSEFLEGGDAVSEDEARIGIALLRGDDVSDILFTSGTTGHPKGVVTAHGQNLRAFTAWSHVVNLLEGDRYLVVSPFFHAFGYKAGWLACIMRGATILPHAVFDVAEILERIGKEKISVLPGAPTIFQSMLAFPGRGDFDLSTLRLAVTGAAPVPIELAHRMRDDLGFDSTVTGYGLTECCGMVSMCHHDDDPETIATTSGCAIPGVEVRCIDPEGNEAPRGEAGEVVVRGYNLMQGYFEDPEATGETIDRQGWLHTGDIAVMDERGYLRITDRIKDMFIMGGFNCYPAEIEKLLFGMDGVAAVAVIGVPDERMGEVAMAFVVRERGANLGEDAVVAWSREHMANYKVPRRVAFVDELPMNAGGKVMKYVLKEQALA